MKTCSLLVRLIFLLLLFLSARIEAAPFAKGADVGWLPQMEATGFKFYDKDGTRQDCLDILKSYGINTIRLRVFVNPSHDRSSGHCSRDEVVAMAQRAQKMDFRIMIDFHYSDSWADPGKQKKPAAWASHTFDQLKDDVATHTTDVLTALRNEGVTPEWVEVGNEITNGMLWPDGKPDNGSHLAELITAGSKAVKAVFPEAKVVIHLHGGDDNAHFQQFFQALQKYGTPYDVIGMSYYPYWSHQDYTKTIDALGRNLTDMVGRFGKEVMVVEVGGESNQPGQTRAMLTAVLDKVRMVPDGKGIGVIYWEPEGAAKWSHYELSCWDDDGKPTEALEAFR